MHKLTLMQLRMYDYEMISSEGYTLATKLYLVLHCIELNLSHKVNLVFIFFL